MTAKNWTRRDFLRGALTLSAAAMIWPISRHFRERQVWQIDPEKCVQCGRCATDCVLDESAVKCIHSYSICGYCDLCGGFLRPDAKARNSAAENMLCPTAAIKRSFIEDPYYRYEIDEALCIGCGKCVKGCDVFGNGSLYLQIKHDRCVDCNECAIARNCPTQAIVRVPASDPYILKSQRDERTM